MFSSRRDHAAPLSTDAQPTKDRAATWLRNAMIALGLLAACAAAVSWTAQYRLVFAVKHLSLIAALEAAIPDAAAFIFASLGIALALHGRRAIRPRVLNVAAVARRAAPHGGWPVLSPPPAGHGGLALRSPARNSSVRRPLWLLCSRDRTDVDRTNTKGLAATRPPATC